MSTSTSTRAVSTAASLEETLHLAPMPFPSAQGTQAAVAAMLQAEARAGRSPALLTYATGAGATPPDVQVSRLRHAFGDRSLRAGPSFPKLAQDLALARALRTTQTQRPLVAHHVEGALAALLARRTPAVWIAHTSLGPELPHYLPAALGSQLRAPLAALSARAGHAMDWLTPRCAPVTLAVSPLLAQMLSERSARRVDWLPLPWPHFDDTSDAARADARARLGLAKSDEVILYAGNLDAYQGLATLLDALALAAARRPSLRFVLASASDPAPLFEALTARRLAARSSLVSLDARAQEGESLRARVHAAADVVVVPREAPGGLPVKMIDAMARGASVACAPLAPAGTDAGLYASLAADSSADAFARAITRVLEEPDAARTRALAGRAWVRTALNDAAYLRVMDEALARARGARPRS